jgi:DNA-binding transcriptional LysR family regulator
MRNLTIERITLFMQEYPDLMVELDISPDELDNLSNRELLDLLIECVEIINEN